MRCCETSETRKALRPVAHTAATRLALIFVPIETRDQVPLSITVQAFLLRGQQRHRAGRAAPGVLGVAR
jgi:hypothetical protein